jgi:hypothetical protein
MDDPSRHADTGNHTGVGPDRGEGMPRWVRVFLIIGIILALLVVLMLTGVFGRQHGPGRHTSSGDPGEAAAAAPVEPLADGNG